MHDFSSTVAIAALSARVLDSRDLSLPRAGVVAALKVTGAPDDLEFAPHVHVASAAAPLTRWVDDLVSDDPLLVGYRLGRTSRLLSGSGYRCNLVGSFSPAGRYDVLDVVRGTPTPLSTIALLHGVMAVDEEALLTASPLDTHVAANLALINAVAAWVIYVGRTTAGKAGAQARRCALRQLGSALTHSPVHGLLAAAMTGSMQ